jgi:hypothetical protein
MAVALFTAASGPLWAGDSRNEAEPAFLSAGIGYFDFWSRDDTAADVRLEYRHDAGLWVFKPWVGVEATSDGAVFGVGGLLVDIDLGPRLVLTPSVGLGAYHDGGGLQLHNTLEFRSQVELAYRFHDRSRLGLAFSHISNASLGDDNPGAEIISLYYHLPLTRLTGE